MAVTFTVTPYKVYSIGDRKEVIANVACTGTATAGGDALTGTALGLTTELDLVEPLGMASVAGGTTGAAVAAIHPATASMTQVLIVFMVQGTAGASNAMVPYTGATANFNFRVRAVGKGTATGTAS